MTISSRSVRHRRDWDTFILALAGFSFVVIVIMTIVAFIFPSSSGPTQYARTTAVCRTFSQRVYQPYAKRPLSDRRIYRDAHSLHYRGASSTVARSIAALTAAAYINSEPVVIQTDIVAVAGACHSRANS